jgi:hypothetical protein
MIAITTKSSTRVKPLRRIRKLFTIIKPFTKIKKQRHHVKDVHYDLDDLVSVELFSPGAGKVPRVDFIHRE